MTSLAGSCDGKTSGRQPAPVADRYRPDGAHAPPAARLGAHWPAFQRPRRDGACDRPDRKSTRLNSSHSQISYAVFCLKKKKTLKEERPRSISLDRGVANRSRADPAATK